MATLKDYLAHMAQRDASDIYLIPGAPAQIKVDGVTDALTQHALSGDEVLKLLHGVMTEQQQRDFADTLEANFAVTVEKYGRYRVNAYYQRNHPSVVVRYLKSHIPSIEELGLPEALKTLVADPRGLFLVVGSTGSGKSTTLAAMIEHRAKTQHGHILTIEDPIEYVHEHHLSVISQREVGIDTLSYSAALKNALREAPDVIMIGEIRDAETMRHAIAYADTGHLCLSTLHANNAYQALERIVNFFPESSRQQVLDDLSLNIRAIFSQRLMHTVDGKRVPACELMLVTPYISDLISRGEFEQIRDAMTQSSEPGMLTFEDSVYASYQAGKISENEAMQHVDSRANLQRRIRLAKGTELQVDEDLNLQE